MATTTHTLTVSASRTLGASLSGLREAVFGDVIAGKLLLTGDARSGAVGFTPKLFIGTEGAPVAIATDWAAVTGGWTFRLSLATDELRDLFLLPYLPQLRLQVVVIEDASSVSVSESVAPIAILRGVYDGPTTPLPSGQSVVEDHEARIVALEQGGGVAGVGSVNGRTGIVVLSKSDVGLSNVDNTSDAAKPVSAAQSTAISAEASSRASGDTSLTTAISTEASTRASADTALSSRVSVLEAAPAGGDVSAEASIRASADTSIAARVSTLEAAGGGDVAAEAALRVSADAVLSSAISVEASARASADVSLSTALSTEVVTRGSTDTVLSTAISAETSARISADASIYAAYTAADVTLSTAISVETSTRISVDTSLSSAASTEVVTRGSTDTVLSTAISTETSTRASADVSLSTAISTASSTCTSADTSLSTRISTEESVRASADTTKQPLDADLTAIAALTGTGYAHRTGADTWVLDTPSGSGAPAQTDAAIDAGTDTEQRTASAAQLKRAALRWVHDPRIISLKEDFQRYIDPTTWYDYTNSGTGAAIAYPSSTVYSGHHGVVTCDTGTTATGYAGVIGGYQFNYSVYPIIDKASVSYAEWNVILRSPASLSDGTDRYSLNAGGVSLGELNANTGFGLYYRDDVNSGKWLACSRQSSSTTVDTGVTVAAATWYNVRITWDGTTLTFFINGTSVATITTNIPTYFIGPGALVLKSVGTTTRQMVVDFISFYAETSTR